MSQGGRAAVRSDEDVVAASKVCGLEHRVRELERLFDRHPPEGATKISFVPTDAMPAGDVALRWREGRAARDTDRLWREVTDALGLHGLTDSAALNKDI